MVAVCLPVALQLGRDSRVRNSRVRNSRVREHHTTLRLGRMRRVACCTPSCRKALCQWRRRDLHPDNAPRLLEACMATTLHIAIGFPPVYAIQPATLRLWRSVAWCTR